MALNLPGTLSINILDDGSIHAQVDMDIAFQTGGFEYAGTSKKPTYRFLIFLGSYSDPRNTNSDRVVEMDTAVGIIGHVSDDNFPVGNDFIVVCQVRCHMPSDIFYPRKYRPLEEAEEFTLPPADQPQPHFSQRWLVPVLHTML